MGIHIGLQVDNRVDSRQDRDADAVDLELSPLDVVDPRTEFDR